MNIDAVITAIGAIMAAVGGTVLVVREFRRRDRKESLAQIEQCQDETYTLRADMLNYRHWAYELSVSLAAAGIPFPPAPPPVHVIKEDAKEAKPES